MPNEMRRPCTLWGETFDAMKVVSLNEQRKESPEHHVRVCISTPHPANRYDSLCVVLSPHSMPPLEAFRIANNTIYEALNAPVLATEAVLDAMNKVPEAKFWVCDDETKYLLEWEGVWKYESKNDSWTNGYDSFGGYGGIPSHSRLQIGDYTQADCPLALQVLLEFNTEGELFDV